MSQGVHLSQKVVIEKMDDEFGPLPVGTKYTTMMDSRIGPQAAIAEALIRMERSHPGEWTGCWAASR